jgi:hypothetical protein
LIDDICGAGILDQATSGTNKGAEVCNPKMFLPGQKVQFFRDNQKTGEAFISQVWKYKRLLVFRTALPAAVKRGDFLVVDTSQGETL